MDFSEISKHVNFWDQFHPSQLSDLLRKIKLLQDLEDKLDDLEAMKRAEKEQYQREAHLDEEKTKGALEMFSNALHEWVHKQEVAPDKKHLLYIKHFESELEDVQRFGMTT